MDNHPEVIGNEGMIRKNGQVTPANAHDVIATVVDITRSEGIPIAPSAKGMMARHAKGLLEAGFTFEVVVTAAVTAVRRGTPQLMDFIAGDLAVVKAGQYMTRRDYQRMLEDEMEIAREIARREAKA